MRFSLKSITLVIFSMIIIILELLCQTPIVKATMKKSEEVAQYNQFNYKRIVEQSPVFGRDKKSTVVPGASPDFREKTIKTTDISETIRSRVIYKAIYRWIDRLIPNQGGIIWLAVILTIIIGFDFKNLRRQRNKDIILIMLPSFLLIDLIHLGAGGHATDSKQMTLFGIVFAAILLITFVIVVRSVFGGFMKKNDGWKPNLTRKALICTVSLLFICTTLITLIKRPDDSGMYTNLGADYMIETGNLPYGDHNLRGGAEATYGPVLYYAHALFQWILPNYENTRDLKRDTIRSWIQNGGIAEYKGPPILATKLTTLFFHVLGILGFILIGKKINNLHIGWGLAGLYIGSAYVLGLGGAEYNICGMTYISHIAPAAVTILAFAMLDRPMLAGALLAIGVGVLFYPFFFLPLWFGYYFWQSKAWGKFVIGFFLVLVVIGTSVFLLTQTHNDESVLQAIYESTVAHQEAKDQYGSSTFSFWGTHPNAAAFWQKPFLEKWHLLRPSFILFVIFLIANFFMAKGRSLAQLAFLTAAIAAAIQLWKSHAGGTYVEWYYPFLLVGLFAQQPTDNLKILEETPIEASVCK